MAQVRHTDYIVGPGAVLMGNADMQSQFVHFGQRVTALRQRAAAFPTPPRERDDVASTLVQSLEELAVAEEELRAQIEELQITREQLEAARDRYRDIFDTYPDACFITDPQGIIRDANQAAGAMLGRTPQDLRGKPLVVN